MAAMKRTERIQIRVTPEERARLDVARGPSSLSNWCRVHLMGVVDDLEQMAAKAVRTVDRERLRAAERATKAKGGER